jgi:hypothetical protein
MRIRIQIQGLMKNWKKLTAEKFFAFFYENLQFSFPLASMKDIQAAAEAFTPQKRASSTSKHEIF